MRADGGAAGGLDFGEQEEEGDQLEGGAGSAIRALESEMRSGERDEVGRARGAGEARRVLSTNGRGKLGEGKDVWKAK